jgi:hypothetical protein
MRPPPRRRRRPPPTPSTRSAPVCARSTCQALSGLEARDGVIPPAARANMTKAVADVLGAADAIGIDNAYNLVRHQSQLLTILTGGARAHRVPQDQRH